MSISSSGKSRFTSSRAGLLSLAAISAATTALWAQAQARRAEREHPPAGRIDIDGVRLHCAVRGKGPPLVQLHGNGIAQAVFETSGLNWRLVT